MQDQQIGPWLEALGSSDPTPGGGSAAAMLAAIAAALVEMVCNLTIGKPRYAEHAELMRTSLATATALRTRATELADADSIAFGAVTDAYKLPKTTDADKALRIQSIQATLAGAADVPVKTAQVAAEVIKLAYRIQPGANVNVLSDVAVAAASAKAALDSAVVNVEINLAGLQDEPVRTALREELDKHVASATMADSVVAAVRYRIASGSGE